MKRLAAVALLLVASACGSPRGANALFVASDDFFSKPWPSDDRIVDGKLVLDGFFDPGGAIGQYLTAIRGDALGEFGTHSAIYFRFDAPIDPASLPQTPDEAAASTASVYLKDISGGGPTNGLNARVDVHFTAAAGQYIGPNWIAIQPAAGYPLRPHTRYAAVISSRVRAADGGKVRPAVGSTPPAELSGVVAATIFTTQDPTPIMRDLRAAVRAQAPSPTLSGLAYVGAEPKRGRYDRYEGTFDSPNFQEGDPPYLRTGGAIHRGADGMPAIVRTESLRVAMTLPKKVPMPADGWPVVLYAHGTGGSYTSFIDDGSAGSAAEVLDASDSPIGYLAMISIDQVLHGPRDPTSSDPDLTFFNIQNIVAARDNPKQGALDDFQLVRLVEQLRVDAAPTTGAPIRFDPSKIYFKGHSQGGLTGPLFLAYEPHVPAAVLSGAGANLIASLLNKTEPRNIPAVVQTLVGEEVDRYHPLLNLLQTYFESADPGNYARLFFLEPPDLQPPKSIYQSLGLVDHYTPVPNLKALAIAMGVQPANPQIEPIEGELVPWGDAPLASNVAAGHATGVACEYEVPRNQNGTPLYDGHFVVFDDPTARRQSNGFLAAHAAEGVARLFK